ncbi:MAG: phosphate ABC transporter permease PstA [Campylobacterales bacterium]
MYKKRKIINIIVLTLSTLSALVGIGFLFWILGVLLFNGFSYITPSTFTQDGAPPMSGEGGLRHALVGHLILTSLATAIGVPVGMLAGTYLSEYGKKGKFAELIRDLSDIMMSAPSIVIGVFVYGLIVMPAGHFSAYAGSVALAIIMIPVIIRTTDDMLGLVPQTLREAAYALGAPKWKVILQVVYKGAATGITTGILLGIARVAGETAPLLFTAFNNNFFSLELNEPIASLTVTMFNYTVSPFEDWQQQGWAAATILALAILTVNIIGRIIIHKKVK